ncbi:uncharacterized protein [Amphiura filiformis]|uniref:uncharacterized protein n=1 Tax=Amphiura filiformis TaxID=82378 RepID=UPI003B21EBC5
MQLPAANAASKDENSNQEQPESSSVPLMKPRKFAVLIGKRKDKEKTQGRLFRTLQVGQTGFAGLTKSQLKSTGQKIQLPTSSVNTSTVSAIVEPKTGGINLPQTEDLTTSQHTSTMIGIAATSTGAVASNVTVEKESIVTSSATPSVVEKGESGSDGSSKLGASNEPPKQVAVGEYGPVFIPDPVMTSNLNEGDGSMVLNKAQPSTQEKDAIETASGNSLIGEYGPAIVPSKSTTVSESKSEANKTGDEGVIGECGPVAIPSVPTVILQLKADGITIEPSTSTQEQERVTLTTGAEAVVGEYGPVAIQSKPSKSKTDGNIGELNEAQTTSIPEQDNSIPKTGAEVDIGEYGPVAIPSKSAIASESKADKNIGGLSKAQSTSTQEQENVIPETGPDVVIGEYGPVSVSGKSKIASELKPDGSGEPSKVQTKSTQEQEDVTPKTGAEVVIGEYGPAAIPSKSAIASESKADGNSSKAQTTSTQEQENDIPKTGTEVMIGEYGPVAKPSKSAVELTKVQTTGTQEQESITPKTGAQIVIGEYGPTPVSDESIASESNAERISGEPCKEQTRSTHEQGSGTPETTAEVKIGEYGPVSVVGESTIAAGSKADGASGKQQQTQSTSTNEQEAVTPKTSGEIVIGEYGPVAIPSKSGIELTKAQTTGTQNQESVTPKTSVQIVIGEYGPVPVPGESTDTSESKTEESSGELSKEPTVTPKAGADVVIGEYGPVMIPSKSIITSESNVDGSSDAPSKEQTTSTQEQEDVPPKTGADVVIGEYGPVVIPSQAIITTESKVDESSVAAGKEQENVIPKTGAEVVIGEYGPVVIPSKSAIASESKADVNSSKAQTTSTQEQENVTPKTGAEVVVGEYGPVAIPSKSAIVSESKADGKSSKAQTTSIQVPVSGESTLASESKAEESSGEPSKEPRTSTHEGESGTPKTPETTAEIKISEHDPVTGTSGGQSITQTTNTQDEENVTQKIDTEVVGEYGPVSIPSRSTIELTKPQTASTQEQESVTIKAGAQIVSESKVEESRGEPSTEQTMSTQEQGSITPETKSKAVGTGGGEPNTSTSTPELEGFTPKTGAEVVFGKYGPVARPSESAIELPKTQTASTQEQESITPKAVPVSGETKIASESKAEGPSGEPNKEPKTGEEVIIGEYGPVVIPSTPVITSESNVDGSSDAPSKEETTSTQEQEDVTPKTGADVVIGEYGPVAIPSKSAIVSESKADGNRIKTQTTSTQEQENVTPKTGAEVVIGDSQVPVSGESTLASESKAEMSSGEPSKEPTTSTHEQGSGTPETTAEVKIGASAIASESKADGASGEQSNSKTTSPQDQVNVTPKISTEVVGEYGPVAIPSRSAIELTKPQTASTQEQESVTIKAGAQIVSESKVEESSGESSKEQITSTHVQGKGSETKSKAVRVGVEPNKSTSTQKLESVSPQTGAEVVIGEYGPVAKPSKSAIELTKTQTASTQEQESVTPKTVPVSGESKIASESKTEGTGSEPSKKPTVTPKTGADVVIGEYGPVVIPSKSIITSETNVDGSSDAPSKVQTTSTQEQEDVPPKTGADVVIGEYGPAAKPSKSAIASESKAVENMSELDQAQTTSTLEQENVIPRTSAEVVIGEYGPVPVSSKFTIAPESRAEESSGEPRKEQTTSTHEQESGTPKTDDDVVIGEYGPVITSDKSKITSELKADGITGEPSMSTQEQESITPKSGTEVVLGEYGPVTTLELKDEDNAGTQEEQVAVRTGAEIEIGEYGPIMKTPINIPAQGDQIKAQNTSSQEKVMTGTADAEIAIGEYGPVAVPSKLLTVSEPIDESTDEPNEAQIANIQKEGGISTTSQDIVIGEYGPEVISSKPDVVSIPEEGVKTTALDKAETASTKEEISVADAGNLLCKVDLELESNEDSNEAPAFGDLDDAPTADDFGNNDTVTGTTSNVAISGTISETKDRLSQSKQKAEHSLKDTPDVPVTNKPADDKEDESPNPVIECKESVIAKRSIAHLLAALKQGDIIDTQAGQIEAAADEEQDEPPPPGVSEDPVIERPVVSAASEEQMETSSSVSAGDSHDQHEAQVYTTDQYNQMQSGSQYQWSDPYHPAQIPFHPMNAWQQSYGRESPYPLMHGPPQHGQWNSNNPRMVSTTTISYFSIQKSVESTQSPYSGTVQTSQSSYQGPVQPTHPSYQGPVQPPHSYQEPVQPAHSYQAPVQPAHSYQELVQPAHQEHVQPAHSYQAPVQTPQSSYQGPVQPTHPSYQEPVQPAHSCQEPVQPTQPPEPEQATQSTPPLDQSNTDKSEALTTTVTDHPAPTQSNVSSEVTQSEMQPIMSAPLSRMLIVGKQDQPSVSAVPDSEVAAISSTQACSSVSDNSQSLTKDSSTDKNAQTGGVKRPLSPLSQAVAEFMSKQPTSLVPREKNNEQDSNQESLPKPQLPELSPKPKPSSAPAAIPQTPTTSSQTSKPIKSKLKLARRGNVLAMAFRQERKLKLAKIQSPTVSAAFGTDESESEKEQNPQSGLPRHQGWKKRRTQSHESQSDSGGKPKQSDVTKREKDKKEPKSVSHDLKSAKDMDSDSQNVLGSQSKTPETTTAVQTKSSSAKARTTSSMEKSSTSRKTLDPSQSKEPLIQETADHRQVAKRKTTVEVVKLSESSPQNPNPIAPSHLPSIHSSTPPPPAKRAALGGASKLEQSPQHLFYVHRSTTTKDDDDKEAVKEFLRSTGGHEFNPKHKSTIHNLQSSGDDAWVLVHHGDLPDLHNIPNLLQMKLLNCVKFAAYKGSAELKIGKYEEMFLGGGLVIPDEQTILSCQPGELEALCNLLGSWSRTNADDQWTIMVHSQMVVQLDNLRKTKPSTSVEYENAYARLQTLNLQRKNNVVTLLQSHACDTQASQAGDYLNCTIGLQAMHALEKRRCVFLSSIDPNSDIARRFSNIGVEVCSLPAFLVKYRGRSTSKPGTSAEQQTGRSSPMRTLSQHGQYRLK